jgi:shikimate kinase
MGVGKSTAGRAVAAKLHRAYRDSDSDITTLTGRTGRETVSTDGVAALHSLEAQVLIEALESAEPLVVSAAASTIEDSTCRRLMAEQAFVVVLTADLETLQQRSGEGAHRRNIPPDQLRALLERRGRLFAQVADTVISAENPADEVTDDIITAWSQFGEPAD